MTSTPKRRIGISGVLTLIFALTLATAAVGVLATGARYYLMSREARVEAPLDQVLAPGGGGGILLGLIGTTLMLAMLTYTVRKLRPGWTWLGGLDAWLRFHIVCGVAGPVFILLHTSFLLPRGMIGVGFWCMVLVATSGIFGRYVYGRFPRLSSGRELAWDEAMEELMKLRGELVAATAESSSGAIGRAVHLVGDVEGDARTIGDLWRVERDCRNRWREARSLLVEARLPAREHALARRMLREQLRLKRSVESARVAGRLMRYWHLFHRPIAAAMYVIVTVHVLVAIVFGGSLAKVMTLLGVG